MEKNCNIYEKERDQKPLSLVANALAIAIFLAGFIAAAVFVIVLLVLTFITSLDIAKWIAHILHL